MEIVITLIVVAWVIYMILKKFYPQAVLLIAGIVLLFFACVFGHTPLLEGKQSSGAAFLDIFNTISVLLSSRVAGLGLMIMSIAGFAKYMEYIGASKSLFALVAAPIKYIKSPYIL